MTEYTIQDQINIYITAITELDNVTRMEHEGQLGEYNPEDSDDDISLYESYEVWMAKQELYACLGELYYKQLQEDNTDNNTGNADEDEE